jgi:hypothetical protein
MPWLCYADFQGNLVGYLGNGAFCVDREVTAQSVAIDGIDKADTILMR